jgi:hypothetical protein
MEKRYIIIALLFMFFVRCNSAFAVNILWMGGEDLDFPNGGSLCPSTTAAMFRAGYARESLTGCASLSYAYSNPFPGGAVTSAWVSAQVYKSSGAASNRYFGFAKSGTNSSLWVGNDSVNIAKVALWTWDGATWTEIASEAGASLVGNAKNRIDFQLTSYGAAATVNIYVGTSSTAAPVITFNGNVVAGTATTVDSVAIAGGTTSDKISEIIVADDSTRNMGLVTLAPNAAGDINQWASGGYSNVNPTTIADTGVINDTTADRAFAANLSPLPSGNYSILAMKVAARGTKAGAGIASLSVGIKSNGTANSPAAVGLVPAWSTTETFYYSTNPVTSAPWTLTDIEALQVYLKTAN